MKVRVLLSVIVALTVFTSCNGSSSNNKVEIAVSPEGVWSVRFTELVDECDVLAPDEEGFGFDSEETITQDGETFTISADELVFGSIDGGLRSSDSLIAEELVTGDIFGVGVNCSLSERLAYNDLTSESANIVYEVVIDCDDGTRCDSLFRAQAVRSE